MNKKLFFLFFSILALITSVNSRENNALFQKSIISPIAGNYTYDTNGGGADKSSCPISGNFTKKHNGPDKNLIRIKAWDNVTTFDVPATWIFTPAFDHTERALFVGYNSYTLSNYLSLASLRGPPRNTMV